MPAWLISIISGLALPVLKDLLISVLTGLEKKYPGITPLVTAIVNYLEAGGVATEVHAHLAKLDPKLCPEPSSCNPPHLVTE